MISEYNTSEDYLQKVPVIVISSHLMGYSVIRSLGVHNIPIDVLYYNNKDFGYISKYVTHVKKTVFPESDEEQFMHDLIALAANHKKCLIIPADDDSTHVLSKHLDKLPEHAIPACQNSETTSLFIEKSKTYHLAARLNIPHPQTRFICRNENIGLGNHEIHCPCLLKPDESHLFFEHYKKKMAFAYSAEEANVLLKKFTDAGFSMLIQEYIPGPQTSGVNHNIYASEGEILVDFTAEKVRTAPTEFSIPRVVVSKNIPEIKSYTQKMIRHIKFTGYACIEYKKDERDNQYKFMEINGRFNRSSLLSVKCGINFPLIMYEHMMYQIQPAKQNFKENVYWVDLTQDVFKT